MLTEKNWFPHNFTELNKFIDSYKHQGHAVVFDWDNTCIFNDISEMFFIYQLEHFNFKLDIDSLEKLLFSKDLEKLDSKVDGFPISLNDTVNAIIEQYKILLEDKSNTKSLYQFKVFMLYYYDYLCNHPNMGAVYAYPWICRLWSGFTEKEIQDSAINALKRELNNIYIDDFKCVYNKQEINISCQRGIQIHEEIIELMQAFNEKGFEIYIITSSPEIIIGSIANELNYPIKPENIMGMRIITEKSILTDRIIDNDKYPMVYGKGKVRVIENNIKKIPVFIAGDSNNDFSMLNHWAETKLRLIINCNNKGPIEEFYLKAKNKDKTVLLQGRSLSTGLFNKLQKTE